MIKDPKGIHRALWIVWVLRSLTRLNLPTIIQPLQRHVWKFTIHPAHSEDPVTIPYMEHIRYNADSIHVWYIYLHLKEKSTIHVGIYTYIYIYLVFRYHTWMV